MRSLLGRSLHSVLCATLLLPGYPTFADDVDLGESARQYEVVGCLLPARIRKLGNMTYPERRQLVETSALKCELRGGEYTFYDRGSPETAADFFRNLAEDGNVDAQVSLGDVYQYLYSEPHYEEAAHWYRQAMENGSAQGQMRLARLYERGLGVPKDGLMATNLWRQATGAGEELVLASELERARTRADQRISELTEALRQKSEESEEIRAELAFARQEFDDRKAALAAAESKLAEAQSKLEEVARDGQQDEEVAALRAQVAEQQRVIDDQRYQMDTLQTDLGMRETELAASVRQAELQNERLRKELERVSAKADEELQVALAGAQAKDQQLARLNERLEADQSELARLEAEYQEVVAALERIRDTADQTRSSTSGQIAELERARAEQQAELDTRREEVESLRSELAAVNEESQQLEQRLNQQIHATAEAEARFASTEAELQRTRLQMNEVAVELQQANERLAELNEERTSVEQQLAAVSAGHEVDVAGLRQTLAAKDERVRSQQARIDELKAEVSQYQEELAAINERRASYAMRSLVTPVQDTSGIRLPRDVGLGKYYSLVIGNNDYQHLLDLKNAANDAGAVHRVLEEEYGFDSTLLVDATEKEIFQAFQELAEKTSDEDLVLIYYAGHGYEVGNESYWLPVEIQSREDAEVSGISSLKVSKWVGAMSAKHVMIIADSCYSGSGIETTGGFRYSLQDLEQMLPFFIKSRSRTMLTSGGVAPVMDGDGAGGSYSVFTKELIGLLKENRGVLYGEALYDHLVERVKYSPNGTAINQTPMFGSIESAGHECGQFVLVHPRMRT